MNLLTDDPTDIAERLAARIAHRGASYVYAKPSGQVATYLVNDVRNIALPARWLVGTYRSPANAGHLLQDLLARRAEIQP
jgi:hypothetical protein